MSEQIDKSYKANHTTRIAVVGLGFVGLPQALLFLNKGFQVTGIDIDQNKIKQLKSGKSYIPDIKDEEIISAISTNRFYTTSNYDVVRNHDVVIICVPTPLTTKGLPDLSYLQDVGEELATRLSKGQLIILESSTFPGTTRDILQPLLEQSRLRVGEDVFLSYSPERIDPGNTAFKIDEIPKIISGVTPKCQMLIQELYSKVYQKVVLVSSTEIAELSKLLENSYRFVNISFINEFAMLCDKLKLDVWEVIDAASTKPYGFQPFYPGPGIGGHCIPVDPLYLIWKANYHGFDIQFLQLANQLNQIIPNYIVSQIVKLLSPAIPIKESTILVYGVTYKKNVGDYRESPSLQIISTLQKLGATVIYHDPLIPDITINDQTLSSSPLNDQIIKAADLTLIVTDHSEIPIQRLLDQSKIVFDTRNVTNGYEGKATVYRLGGGNQS